MNERIIFRAAAISEILVIIYVIVRHHSTEDHNANFVITFVNVENCADNIKLCFRWKYINSFT
jgi:hypothetical protein